MSTSDPVQAKSTFFGNLTFFLFADILVIKLWLQKIFENRCGKLYQIFDAVGTKFCGQVCGSLYIIKLCGKKCGYTAMWLHIFKMLFSICECTSDGMMLIFWLLMY